MELRTEPLRTPALKRPKAVETTKVTEKEQPGKEVEHNESPVLEAKGRECFKRVVMVGMTYVAEESEDKN